MSPLISQPSWMWYRFVFTFPSGLLFCRHRITLLKAANRLITNKVVGTLLLTGTIITVSGCFEGKEVLKPKYRDGEYNLR